MTMNRESEDVGLATVEVRLKFRNSESWDGIYRFIKRHTDCKSL